MASKTLVATMLLVSVVFYNCKKKDKTSEETTPPATTVPLLSSTNGVIQASYFRSQYNTTTLLDSSASIAFYESPGKTTSYVDAGTVSVNNLTLTYSPSTGYQNYNTERVNLHTPLNWVVSGSPSSTVVPFTYSHLPVIPQYSGYSALPDTCVKASGISLNISGMSNFNMASVSIGQMSQNKFKVISGNSTITFSAQEISGFNTSDPVSVMISVSNMSTVKIGNVPYTLLYSTLFSKTIVLK